MGYTRLRSSESPALGSRTRSHCCFLFCSHLCTFFLLVAGGLLLTALFLATARQENRSTHAIARTCEMARFPGVCRSALSSFPGAARADERALVHMSIGVATQRASQALSTVASSTDFSKLISAALPRARAAYNDCVELLDDAVDHLSRSLAAVENAAGSEALADDVMTWLSAALTSHGTCVDSLDESGDGRLKNELTSKVNDLSPLISNSLAIFAAAGSKDFSGIPIHNKRRKLLSSHIATKHGFPTWLTRTERTLLLAPAPAAAITADMVVDKNGDGNGTYRKIAEAVKAAPEYSARRIVIYVKAGIYNENVKVGRKKTNIMFVGDGKGKTIVAGSRSVADNFTTFHTATFAASGNGIIIKDMTIENWAGPAKHQAVALRIGADHAVVYRCNIIGYQDTLYVHSQRQFFRECDIYGTVDFVFGNAAVVFQNCSLWARKPLDGQKNTVTAQNRKDPNQNTGISIHGCRVVATPDLVPVKSAYPTYLGRPWKMYSRTIYMMSYIGDHIPPEGWLEWNATFALDTLFYGEYMNYGPGGAVDKRVKWKGYRVINSSEEASKFTVRNFIGGSSWIPSTGVAYQAGLSL